ncbi:hypothetical protein [Caryophanon tenue]|uniref:DUF3906 domain-containing protein n=1 Tax=Caryophanon tenue TaxID=33978 RepID=A0A1C0Y511_9BACL|nr:hypothetical protein [Caryophanon tenue]OCS82267.1 hypothetical protein A6M13_07475 [Caryophanon tenue]
MKKYHVTSHYSEKETFNMLIEAESIDQVIEEVQTMITSNNFYRNKFDDEAEVYFMGAVKYVKIKEEK